MVRVLDLTEGTDPKNFDERPDGMRSLEGGAIVLHHTGGMNSIKWLQTYRPRTPQNPGGPTSTHKVFSKDGTINILVYEQFRAWHAGVTDWGGRSDWNDFSIGYEIENLGNGRDPYTDEQYEAIAQSLAYDTARFHIADRWVQDHRTIAVPRGRKTDPVGLDEKRIWRRVFEIRADWPETWPVPRWYAW